MCSLLLVLFNLAWQDVAGLKRADVGWLGHNHVGT